jgi:hypothetical protein
MSLWMVGLIGIKFWTYQRGPGIEWVPLEILIPFVYIYKTFVPIWSWYIELPIQDWFVTSVKQVYALGVLKLV